MKTYILHGKPIPQKRARITRFGNYDPQKAIKNDARYLILDQRGPRPKIEGEPINVILTFFMPIPKSTPKRINLKGAPHHKRPDIDNLIKFILDVIQGVLITDDAIVSSIEAHKIYSDNPRTEITIKELI